MLLPSAHSRSTIVLNASDRFGNIFQDNLHVNLIQGCTLSGIDVFLVQLQLVRLRNEKQFLT